MSDVMKNQKCISCGLEVIGKYGDTKGWKGIQTIPNDVMTFVWYCNNPLCQERFKEVYATAEAAWAGG